MRGHICQAAGYGPRAASWMALQFWSLRCPLCMIVILLSLLQRHFSVFAVHFPGADALATIFSSILSAHFLQGGFSYGVSRSVGTLIQVHSNTAFFPSNIAHKIGLFWLCFILNIQAAICLHQKISQNFLPTAIRFHYIFNLRDLTNIFQVTNNLHIYILNTT